MVRKVEVGAGEEEEESKGAGEIEPKHLKHHGLRCFTRLA